jgi:hypothetical protein
VVRIPPGVPDGLHNQETASARALGAQRIANPRVGSIPSAVSRFSFSSLSS